MNNAHPKISREYPQQPIVGVGAVIVENSRVLLIQRAKEPLFGQWSIPGGMLEVGETVREGAEREALEETGLIVRATELLGVFDRIVPTPDIEREVSSIGEKRTTLYHYVLVDFLCERISGAVTPGGDAADACWFTSADVENLPLPEDTRSVLRLALSRNK
ncbi:MAG TPA: NUDIX hydrolase [Terriglobales bacterium]